MKIAFCVHRYGEKITGGAEQYTRSLANYLSKSHEIEVLTTCAREDSTWANYFKAGISFEGAVIVRRFRTDHNRCEDWEYVHSLVKFKHEYEDEVRWLEKVGPVSESLLDYIRMNYSKYDAIIFVTYLYYHTAVGSLGIPNAILMPTAHNESPIYLSHYDIVFSDSNGFLFLTDEEKDFVNKRFTIESKPQKVVGVGIDSVFNENDVENVKKQCNINDPFILYCGRISKAKGCDEILNLFMQYKDGHPDEKLNLYLTGSLSMTLPEREDIKYLG